MNNGQILTESVAVLVYIVENAANRAKRDLMVGPRRYEVLQWTAFAATEIHQRFMRFPSPGLSPESMEATREQLKARFKFAAAWLGRSGYLVGDDLTIADILLYTTARWPSFVGIDVQQWPALAKFMTAVEARPSVQRALKEEGVH